MPSRGYANEQSVGSWQRTLRGKLFKLSLQIHWNIVVKAECPCVDQYQCLGIMGEVELLESSWHTVQAWAVLPTDSMSSKDQ